MPVPSGVKAPSGMEEAVGSGVPELPVLPEPVPWEFVPHLEAVPVLELPELPLWALPPVLPRLPLWALLPVLP